MGSAERLERWESRSEWVLAGVAVVFLVAYSVQVLANPGRGLTNLLNGVMSLLYLVFVVDYLVRLSLAPHRVRWFFRHLLDLAIVVLPFLRPLRLLRLVVLVKVLHRAGGDAIRGRVAAYTALSAVLLVYVASLAMLETERNAPDSTITSFGNAVWWSITTVTTVGYGDLSPVTATGRVIAVLLMIGGISLIGVITATVASWIVERVAQEDSANRAATAAQIDDLREEIRQLSARVHTREDTRDDAWSPR
ncbi:potassium channel family protein [Mycolicibacterium hippocampi]|uniref:Potassium voltage-gated channel subfamily KQT n=1 Tax=Mycolicibacterium hippocampi TaxID=659824 RepID=A0A850PRI8_9MYCO|nr:potassium channel family protein [Mycolicibacterium hippocampi]NVN50710.1 Potassium voltage-gated channel subfamily KQT [Mycolicibacterium hippocampi]